MWSQDLYLKAIDFAATAHKDQKAENKKYSYVVHFTNVCMEVIGCLFYSNVDKPDLAVQCALLHDTIEDTEVTYNDILADFGKEIADGVLSLTKNKKLQKEIQILDSLNRILTMPVEIGIVKLADRIVNLQAPPKSWTKEKIESYLQDAKLIYEKLNHCNKYLSNRLLTKIENYKKYIL